MHRFRLFIQSRSRLIHHWVSYYSCLENVSQPTGGFIFTFSESVFVLVCHSLHSKMTPPLEQSTLCSLIKGHHVDGCVWKRWTFRYLKTTRVRHKTCSCLSIQILYLTLKYILEKNGFVAFHHWRWKYNMMHEVCRFILGVDISTYNNMLYTSNTSLKQTHQKSFIKANWHMKTSCPSWL